MPAFRTFVLVGLTSLSALGMGLVARPTQAAVAGPDLATAGTFAVLAASTVTNTGPSSVSGDLGVSPGTAVTGFGPGTVIGGTIHAADAVALAAQNDLTTAYNTAAGLPPTAQVTADLGGQHLVPGVYSGPTLSLTGALTLDAGGDADAVFVFQAGSTLVTASASSVLMLGGANPCHVFWQVGSSATLGTGSTFTGSVLAHTSVTASTGVTVQGRLLARTGAVTLDRNTITRPLCAAAVVTPTPSATSPASSAATPTPTPTASSSSVATPSSSAPATPVGASATPVPTASRSSAPTPARSASAAPPTRAAAPSGPSVAAFGPQPVTQQGRTAPVANPGVAPPASSVLTPAAPPFRPNSPLPRTGAPTLALLRVALLLMLLGSLAFIAGAPRGRDTHF